MNTKRFTELTQIYKGNGFLVYKGFDLKRNKRVALKTIGDETSGLSLEDLLQKEYSILKMIDHDQIVKAVEIINEHPRVLVLEYIDGHTLKELIGEQRLSQDEKIEIALSLIDALGAVHTLNIIHKDINPANIIWNPIERKSVIIDFNLSEIVRNYQEEYAIESHLKGTLPYVSPEQTGRVNRGIDNRTDYYSLGVTLYELFVGKLPFETEDYLSMIHAHIAKIPKAPADIREGVPVMLSKIIMKLLEKNPEKRYSDLMQLKEDILRVSEDRSVRFEICQKNMNRTYHLRDGVYGREKEAEKLKEAFTQTVQGKTSLVWLSGYSGVGKTTIVKQLFKPLTISKGYFLDGKYDQYSKNQPYAVIRNIFDAFYTQLSFEGLEAVAHWIESVETRLGQNLSVMFKIIPELKTIFKVDEDEYGLSLQESQNRLKRTVKLFIESFSTKERPIIVFMDDLQWIDYPALELIEDIILGGGIPYFMLIGAYRINEVDASHRLTHIREISFNVSSDIDIADIVVNPLSVQDMVSWLKDSFGEVYENILSGLVKKTRGNPFYMKQLVRQIAEDELVAFDSEADTWVYEADLFDHLDIYANVAEILAKQLKGLADQVKSLLALAACLGHEFDQRILLSVSKMDMETLDALLYYPILEGYIVKRKHGHLAFGHDQIQQACYCLVDADTIKVNHLEIYHAIKDHASVSKIEIARHIIAAEEHADQIIKSEQCDVLYEAGVFAFVSIAYDDAIEFFKAALKIGLESEDYEICMDIYNHLGKSYYALGLFDELDVLFERVKIYARQPVDMAPLYDVEVHSHMSRLMHKEGLELAIEALNAFGIEMTLDVTPQMYGEAMGRLANKLNNRRPSDLIDLPLTDDQSVIGVMQMLTGLTPLLFNTAPQLLLLVFVEMIMLSLEHGNCKYSAFGYAFYGTVISGNMGMIQEGVAFARLALDLIEKMNAKSEIPKINMVTAQHVLYYEIHPSASIELLETGFNTGIEIGDYSYAGFAGHGVCFMSFLAGRELSNLSKLFSRYSKAFEAINQQTQLLFQKIYQQAIDQLAHGNETCTLEGKWFSESGMMPEIIERNHRTAAFVYYYLKTYICLIYEQYDMGLEASKALFEYLDGGTGLMHALIYYQMDGLIRLGISAKEESLLKAYDNLSKMENVKDSINFKHRYLLLAAEIKRAEKKFTEARELYDLALQETVKHRFIADEALCREYMSRFYAEQEYVELFKYYKKSAYECYMKWGALGKARYMYTEDKTYGLPKAQSSFKSMSTKISGYDLLTQLDLETIIKISRIIAKEINIEKMMEKSLAILLENAGATKASMLCRISSEHWLKATVDSGRNSEFSTHSDVASMNLPQAVINYILSKKESLNLSNALEEEFFRQDSYVIREGVQSVFGHPLMNQGELIGVVYLENNQTAYVFSEDRASFIRHIAIQIAISLRNALTYRHMEAIVQQRTDDLKAKNEELLELNDKLQKLSTIDTLTQVFNRRKVDQLLQDVYKQYQRYGAVFSVILLDVDHFKKVNDTYGHNVGDDVLVKIAQTLKRNLREVDALARWGGEEFFIICPNTSAQSACDLAVKLRGIIEDTRIEVVGNMTCSFGTATITEGMQIKDLLKIADMNMYDAKTAGRNCVKCCNN